MLSVVFNLAHPKPLSQTFADNEWSDIIKACHRGRIPASWAPGDSKAMMINGASYQIVIIGRYHDTYTSGGTAPLTLQLRDYWPEQKQMNASQFNIYKNCLMTATHLPAILAMMPSEVQNGIQPVNKQTSAGNGSTNIITTSEKLFLVAEVEALGSTTYSMPGEGQQYEFYQIPPTNKSEPDQGQWTRSPNVSTTDRFCTIWVQDGVYQSGSFRADYNHNFTFTFCF